MAVLVSFHPPNSPPTHATNKTPRLDCQNDLSASLTRLNPNSKLLVLREAPQTLFPKLFRAWNVTHLVFEKDTDAYARDRDAAILACAKKAGVHVLSPSGRTLWDSDALVAANGNKPTMTISQLQAAGAKIGPIAPAIDAPASIPDPGEVPLKGLADAKHHEQPSANPDFNAEARTRGDNSYAALAGPNGDFAPPTLEELGFPPATSPHRGGETFALARLDEVMAADKGRYAATFRKPQTSPAAFAPQSTTLLSPFLHFGALSPRLFYHRAEAAVKAHKGKDASGPPESLTGQLLFRDMYFAAQAALGHAMAQTTYNPVVRFVPWHLPSKLVPRDESSVDTKTKEIAVPNGEYEVDSATAEEWFRRWRGGVTGFPWIDALMRQLRHDGWIHHLGRHAVACFLTRGGCYVHWERGAEVFQEWLLDHESACNSGNWQWLSCTAFFSQYYRCYSPVAFPQKWDKEGEFVKHWCPELKGLTAKYIYEPWKAPVQDLKEAGVKLVPFPGVDVEMEEGTYPKPIFDFAERRTVCIASLKKAYEVALRGNDKKVLDGSYKSLFEGGGENEEMMGSIHGVHEDEDGGDGKTKGTKRAKGPMDRHLKKQKR